MTPDDARALDALMDFDHVVRSDGNGNVVSAHHEWAPTAYVDCDAEGNILDLHPSAIVIDDGWHLMNGYSGQDGYSGPLMHSSEFIGGQMARDIYETPGLYCTIIVNCLGADDPETIAGWAVAYREEES